LFPLKVSISQRSQHWQPFLRTLTSSHSDEPGELVVEGLQAVVELRRRRSFLGTSRPAVGHGAKQLVWTVDRLDESVAVAQVLGHLERIHFGVRLLRQRCQLPQQHSISPLKHLISNCVIIMSKKWVKNYRNIDEKSSFCPRSFGNVMQLLFLMFYLKIKVNQNFDESSKQHCFFQVKIILIS